MIFIISETHFYTSVEVKLCICDQNTKKIIKKLPSYMAIFQIRIICIYFFFVGNRIKKALVPSNNDIYYIGNLFFCTSVEVKLCIYDQNTTKV